MELNVVVVVAYTTHEHIENIGDWHEPCAPRNSTIITSSIHFSTKYVPDYFIIGKYVFL